MIAKKFPLFLVSSVEAYIFWTEVQNITVTVFTTVIAYYSPLLSCTFMQQYWNTPTVNTDQSLAN